MPIETGKLAYVKSSDEPVFVLDIEAQAGGKGIVEYPSLENTMVIVRRPIATDHGIQHDVDRFHIEELESFEDKVRRQYEEVRSSRNLVTGRKVDAPDMLGEPEVNLPN